jgi:hypothetical protein
MATEEYWNAQRDLLLDSPHGPLARLPMSPEALAAYGPMSAVEDALRLLVLGLPDRAADRLEFVPRLRALLAGPDALAHLTEPDRMHSAASLREALHLGTWLLGDRMSATLAAEAGHHLCALNRWFGGRPTPPNLHRLMLLSVESGDAQGAADLYRANEARPLSLPPRDRRFTSNARAVLYACLAGDAVPLDVRSDAVEALRRKATRWERSTRPIPYVGPVELARTLKACHQLMGRPHDLASILPLVA